MRVIAAIGILLLGVSLAHAKEQVRAKQKATLDIPILPAESLPPQPLVPVRIEGLAGDRLAELMSATAPARRAQVRTAALKSCGALPMDLADCLGLILRVNGFLERNASERAAAAD